MNNYRYILDKSSRKFLCPSCGKKRFVRYIDTETNNYLPDQYGRCDREINCPQQEYNNPYLDGYAKAMWKQEQGNKTDWKPKRPPRKTQPPKPKLYPIPYEVLKSTQSGYERNIFIQNLLSKIPFPFEVCEIEKIIALYQLGTVPESGAVCFPFIDKKNRVRAIQEKIFDHANHTDKTKQYHTSWIHSRLKYTTYRNRPLPQWVKNYEQNDTKVSCLFGEHLLTEYSNNPVALVEAPKTAIYGTLYFGFPDQHQNLLWLAVYNLSSLTFRKCKVLEGRDVFLFPDLSTDGKAFDLWSEKAGTIQRRMKNTCFKVPDLLERLAPEQDKDQGTDIADYLIKLNWREFRTKEEKPVPIKVENTDYPTSWNKETDDPLKSYENIEADQAVQQSSQNQPNGTIVDERPTDVLFTTPNQAVQRTKPIIRDSAPSKETEAYTNHQDELLIQNPMDANRFTVYPDIDSYNHRSVKPESRYKHDIDLSKLTPVLVDPMELKVYNH